MDRQGEGSGQVLEQFRPYLSHLARQQLDEGLWEKIDLSGVIQQTLLEAHQKIDQVHGKSDAEQRAWLRAILAHNLTDGVRFLRAEKRNLGRQRSLQAALEDSSARLEALLVAEQSSPSQRAIRNEELLRLPQALAQLPPDQRQAVELRYLQEATLADIAQRMERSKGAVAKLIQRGLEKLTALLAEPD